MGLLVYGTPMFCLSGAEWGFGLSHFTNMFSVRAGNFISYLVEKKKPKAVIVCMIYYPCEGGEGWADAVLEKLQYEQNPKKLQKAIDLCYKHGTRKVVIPGYNTSNKSSWWGGGNKEEQGLIIPVALSDCLDSKNEAHYDKRVEPSVLGGKRMAQHFFNKLWPDLARPLPEDC
mmetsp:Transcript_36167/g.56655  ORF Transcript_36167/g.56655 Transcript_36167/m.56655 type:complete len:173 (-) Transcript_36167:36-554(-)